MAREQRPVVEEGERASSSKTTCGVRLAGDDRAEAAAVGPRSGNDRERAGLDPELELAVVADVVAVHLDGNGAEVAAGVARDRLDPRLGDALEVVDLAVAVASEAASGGRGAAIVGMSR